MKHYFEKLSELHRNQIRRPSNDGKSAIFKVQKCLQTNEYKREQLLI